MGDISSCPPLTRASVQTAHAAIKQHIHRTPTITCDTISHLASTPQTPESLQGTPFAGRTPSKPRINLFFKCENYQKIGAFKARGAFHALSRLSKEELSKGVVTHSSGNHAQALALAARTHGIPAHIVMPTISTPSKIAATKGYGANVIFSGSTSGRCNTRYWCYTRPSIRSSQHHARPRHISPRTRRTSQRHG
jgi:threonine dehydratase